MPLLKAVVSPLCISAIYAGLAMFYIFLSDRVLAWFIRDPDRLTTAQTIKGWTFVIITALLLYSMVLKSNTFARRAKTAILAANRRFRRMVETTNEGVWIVDEAGQTLYANRAMADILGVRYSKMAGSNQRDFLDEQWATRAMESIRRLLAGETHRGELWFRRPDGSEAWVLLSSAPFVDRRGKLNGVLRMVTDISEQKLATARLERALEAQQMLVNELDHRVRNTLASILTLIDTTRAETTEMGEYSKRITGRIYAMCTAHAMMLRAIKRELPLQAFIAGVFADVGEHRIVSEGPQCNVPHRAVVPIALALHELKEWSSQHGALSSPSGQVRVRWDASDCDQPEIQTIIWQENQHHFEALDGELSLVEGLVRSDLRGYLDCHENPDGWCCEMHLGLMAPIDPVSRAATARSTVIS
ncbi:MAG: PAS domain S-box protein [Phycisphaerales bacterium]|nr:PAS domain S-box protein [Phycisphaerales bacterium]